MQDSSYLTDIWYMAMPASKLKIGHMLAKTLLGQSILFGRDKTGEVFALRNLCPHRGIPLHYGQFDGCEFECCYHRWRFNTAGVCTDIPSLVSEQKFNVSRIKVFKFPCQEIQGNIWIYMPSNGKMPAVLPALPKLPSIDNQAPQM